MKFTKLALSLLVSMGTGCTSVRTTSPVSLSELPNCFDTNYDAARGLFTIRNAAGNAVNQQCLLTVGRAGSVASASRLAAGTYRVYLSNGGGGGAGGNLQAFLGGAGGGGGGGAGAAEVKTTVNLTEGVYKLTIGAGGPGGVVCLPGPGFGGGPGWPGSPSNMVRVATGELVVGTPGADSYARLTSGQNQRMAGIQDAHGGSGPGQTSGGAGTVAANTKAQTVMAEATSGASTTSEAGGATGTISAADKNPGVGGGGGASSIGQGGGGGGQSPGQEKNPAERGSLGSGGGGGEGTLSKCEPGARGGNGYIALRPI